MAGNVALFFTNCQAVAARTRDACVSFGRQARDYWRDESAWHRRTGAAIAAWWQASQLKRGGHWLVKQFNRVMEASLPFSRAINFSKNWIQGFACIWGVMAVYALAADPMIILAGGAIAVSNVAFAAALLVAFAYAYYHYRVEKNQVALAEQQAAQQQTILTLEHTMAEQQAASAKKIECLERQMALLEKRGDSLTEFLAPLGFCPAYDQTAETHATGSTAHATNDPETSKKPVPSYIA